MRSNTARPCPSSRVPERAAELMGAWLLAAADVALELPEEGHEGGLLLLRQVPVGGHRGGGVLERAADRRREQLLTDVGQLRPRPAVAVLADLVTGQAARLS